MERRRREGRGEKETGQEKRRYTRRDENEREEEKKRARRLTASTETFKSEEARGSICNSHVSAKLSGQPVARILTALHTPDACWVKVKLCERKLWKALEKGVRGKFVREEVALEMFPPFLNIPSYHPLSVLPGNKRKSFPYLRLNVNEITLLLVLRIYLPLFSFLFFLEKDLEEHWFAIRMVNVTYLSINQSILRF